MKNIVILGSTGSIGTQTLDVIRNSKDKFKIVGLACLENTAILEKQVQEFQPEFAVVSNPKKASEFQKKFPHLKIDTSLSSLVKIAEADLIVNALCGSCGILPTFAAIRAKKNIAIANKETIVSAGEFLMEEAKKNGVRLIPIDSETTGFFQLLENQSKKTVNRLILTASGGPFFGKTKHELHGATKKQVLKHPTWKMGRKVTVDCATLMNKAMEMMECHYFFGISPDKIDIVVHRESIIHAMVEFIDGNTTAFMCPADMKFLIQYALFYPERFQNNLPKFEFPNKTFSFYEPDFSVFEGPKLARECLKQGFPMPALLSLANELAVSKFLNNEIKFVDIYPFIKNFLARYKSRGIKTFDDYLNFTHENLRDFIMQR